MKSFNDSSRQRYKYFYYLTISNLLFFVNWLDFRPEKGVL